MHTVAFAAVAAPAISTPHKSAPLVVDTPAGGFPTSGIANVRWRAQRHGGWHYDHRLAAGAIIGGAIASGQARADTVAYCSPRTVRNDTSPMIQRGRPIAENICISRDL